MHLGLVLLQKFVLNYLMENVPAQQTLQMKKKLLYMTCSF